MLGINHKMAAQTMTMESLIISYVITRNLLFWGLQTTAILMELTFPLCSTSWTRLKLAIETSLNGPMPAGTQTGTLWAQSFQIQY